MIINVSNVEYCYDANDINYDELECYDGTEEDYIAEQKAKIAETYGTDFEFTVDDNEVKIYDNITDYISDLISDTTGFLVEHFNYEIE